MRRLICVILLLCLAAATALADPLTTPPVGTLSLGYRRLQEALVKGKTVRFEVSTVPEALSGYEGNALSGMAALLSALQITGEVTTASDGGRFKASVLSGGQEVLTIGQASSATRVGFLVGDAWINMERGAMDQDIAMLRLEDIAGTLSSFTYEGLREGDVPFLSALERMGMELWVLASPYSTDNNRLSVPSGPTSHATSYSIDTAGLVDILLTFAEEMTMDGLTLGGGAVSMGFDESGFEAFRQRLSEYAQTVEVTSPFSMNMTFGAGDVMRTAKGSGKLKDAAGRTSFSVSYTCSPSSTRNSARLSVDFQPKGAQDTIKLSYSAHESSDGKKRAAKDMTLTMTGIFDGKPYRIAIEYDMRNEYALSADNTLTEELSGTLTATLQYDGVKLLELTAKRKGNAQSVLAQDDISISDTITLTVKQSGQVTFSGQIILRFSIEKDPDTRLDLSASQLENADFTALPELRDLAQEHLAGFRQRLVDALPEAALEGILNGY